VVDGVKQVVAVFSPKGANFDRAPIAQLLLRRIVCSDQHD
jgi:hypothetical protein